MSPRRIPSATEIDDTVSLVREAASSLPVMCEVVGRDIGIGISAELRDAASAIDAPDWSIVVDRGPARLLGIRSSGSYGELCTAWAEGPSAFRIWVLRHVMHESDARARPCGCGGGCSCRGMHADEGWDPDEPMPADAFDGLTFEELGLPPEGCVVRVNGVPVSFPEK